MSSQGTAAYSVVVTIVYFSIYASVFFAASIFCAYEVKTKFKSKNDDFGLELAAAPISLCSRKFLKLWVKSLWKMKKIYISIIPHIFDQATDLGVLFQYHAFWKNNTFTAIKAQYWFFTSIIVIVLYKFISCISVYLLTKSPKDVVYQFFDVLMLKAVYANYKLKTDEPSNAQRYLQVLEATFESGPQILISMAFILKTNVWDGIVLVSIFASLWTLTSRVASDDKSVVADRWKSIEFTYKRWPIVNWRYIFRVIFWRLSEITNKISLYTLIWLSIGGFSLIIIILFEFFCCICVSYMANNFVVMGNLLYFTIINGSSIRMRYKLGGKILAFAKCYRFYGLYMLLTLVTVFVMVDFNAWKVPDYSVRHQDVINDPFGLTLLIYCWITSIIWPVGVIIMVSYDAFEFRYAGRDVTRLIATSQWKVLLELVEFGLSIGVMQNILVEAKLTKTNIDNINHQEVRANRQKDRDYAGLIQFITDLEGRFGTAIEVEQTTVQQAEI
eukprot:356643_1